MYEPSRHFATFNVAGFQFYDGAFALGDLHAGSRLRLVPEPENPHDPYAMQIYFGDVKLGYVPKDVNSLLSHFFFFGHGDVFEVRVLQVDPKLNPWEQVRVGIYITDQR